MGNQYISKGITPQFLKCAGVSCWLLYRLSNGQNREVVQGSKRIQPVRLLQSVQWRSQQQGHESESHSWKPCYCHRKHWYWWQYWACPLSSRNSPPCYYWPSRRGDFPSANNKEILQPYILNSHQHKSDFPNSLFCSVQHQITWHGHNETHIHTDYKCSHSVTVFVCHCVGVTRCWWHFCRRKMHPYP